MKRFLLSFLFLCLHQCLLFGAAQEIIFKEYDLRGIVGEEFTEEDSYDLTRAITSYLIEEDSTIQTIALGADGRVHSPSIKKFVTKALIEQGFDVLDLGTCTTPIMYYAMHTMPADAGMMITASHNPGEYNGIKICRGKTNVSGVGIKKIRDRYFKQEFIPLKESQGKLEEIDSITLYVDHLMSLFPHLLGSDINAIVDCGNGAAGTVLPQLVKRMNWKNVALLYPEIDGTYPNHIADPTVEKYMQDLKRELLNSNAEVGIGFDGDCDRMAPMTKSGKLVKGDQLLTIYGQELLANSPGSSIVFDISSSRALHEVIKKSGGIPHMSPTGIAQVKKKMIETNALIGGEISCHTFFKDRYFGFDDGVYSMLRLFELLKNKNKSLDEYLDAFPTVFTSPLYRLPCQRSLCLEIIESVKEALANRTNVELITIEGLRIHLPDGWAIIRPSNTEPLISMRFEGYTEEGFLRMKKEFYELISPFLNCTAFFDKL